MPREGCGRAEDSNDEAAHQRADDEYEDGKRGGGVVLRSGVRYQHGSSFAFRWVFEVVVGAGVAGKGPPLLLVLGGRRFLRLTNDSSATDSSTLAVASGLPLREKTL
jgi:hypothetical protein